MKKLLLLTLLIVGCIKFLIGQDYYISPGIQIGINSSKEFFYSYQITSGIINESLIPGITIGRRHYKRDSNLLFSYNYIDAQFAFVTVGGGVGIIFNRNERFIKYKMFAGYGGLASYDYINFKDKPKDHFGGFGVLPLCDCCWCF